MAIMRILGREGGFTLVELMVVVAIIATLAGLYAPAVRTAAENAALYKAREDLRALDAALMLGQPPSPLPSPPALLPGAAGEYQLDAGARRAYLPVTVRSGQIINLYSDTQLKER